MAGRVGLIGLLKRYGFELLVVFLGVWLSLLAESWRQNQILIQTERESLSRLASDLEDDLHDLQGNLVRAQHGLEGAQWMIQAQLLKEASRDTMASMLAQMGPCSNLGENTSEYISMKSSGNLNVIRDEDLRQDIVGLYEGRSFLRWWHGLDCTESDAVLDLLSEHLQFGVPPVDRDGPDSENWQLRRHPTIESISDVQSIFRDRTLMNRITRLASMRQALERAIRDEIEKTADLQTRANEASEI